MKRTTRLIAILGIGCIGLLAGCNNDSSTSPTSSTNPNSSVTTPVETGFYVTYKGAEVSDGDSLTIDVNDQVARLYCHDLDTGSDVTSSASFSSSNPTVLSVAANGMLTALQAGTATITVTDPTDAEFSLALNFTVTRTTVATGVNSYSTVDYDEKANILGVLEKYAVENYLTGITLFSNGGYVAYNSRYRPTPTSYVSGYGWGTMREGRLNGVIENPETGHDPSYYQVGTTAVASHANAMDASGSDVSDIASYFTTSYYSTRLNATNDGYEWYPSLATDARPVAVDDNGNIISSNYNRRWRIHLRTKANGDTVPVYRTSSTATMNGYNISQLNGKEVELTDYLTPFKLMLTAWNGQYRGSELTDGVSGFSGAASYYNSTTEAPDDGSIYDENAWASIMGDEKTGLTSTGERGNIIVGTDDEGDYIEFNLLYPCTQFYAMYYLSFSLYSPLPIDFVKAVTPNYLGAFPDDYSPADTMVSTGPYYIDRWQSGQYIKLSRNDNFYEYIEGYTLNDGTTTRTPYQIPGFEWTYHESSELQNLFETGSIDSYNPTSDTLDTTYNTDSGTSSNGIQWNRYQTEGDANFKLNVNSTTPEQWEEYFGTSGNVYAHDSASTAQWVETREERAYLSDKNFLDFLSFALDRQTICESRGTVPTQDYFSDNYLIDPESGVSYNSTDAHAAVLADRFNSTYGYSSDDAKESLALAFEDTIIPMAEAGLLPATGTGAPGSHDNPYRIVIDMSWMNTDDVKNYGDVFTSITNAFSEFANEEFRGGYTLIFHQINGTSDYNEVYNKMKQGEFDLGFGAISGNDLNPLNFFEVLKSDNSSGFTLNWGPDTSEVSDDIVYDGKTWSFDGLWQASDSAALLDSDGNFAEAQNVSTGASANGITYQTINNTDRTVTYRISFEQLVNAGAKELSVSWTNGDVTASYTNEQLQEAWDSNYVASITVGSEFNSASNVTLRVNFTITITDINGDSMNTETSSTISLLSYYGITR